MKDICVITGGGSGMGLEVAKIVGKNCAVVLTGRTVKKLDDAVNQLNVLGVEAYSYACDASDRLSVKELVKFATNLGTVKTVIHSAGVSPTMADGEKIFLINAVGTVNVVEEFGRVISDKGCILNVASMAGYMLPKENTPTHLYKLAFADLADFESKAVEMINSIPKERRSGTAYTISKNFVVWYTQRVAVKYGQRGVRVVSISPGTFSTPMGIAEGEQAASFALAGALGRVGETQEIAKMMAFMVSDECSYLTGTDILYDGGAISAMIAKNDNVNL